MPFFANMIAASSMKHPQLLRPVRPKPSATVDTVLQTHYNRVMKINDTTYQVDDALGAPVLLVAPDYLTLVDTSVQGSEDKIFALIESLGRQRTDLHHILITHSDGDHVGSLPALVAATGANVYAQAQEAAVIEGKRPARSGQNVAKPVTVGQVVREGDMLDLHGGILVVETFGHTVGHVSYYMRAARLLIVGDCIVNTQGLASSIPQYTYDAVAARQTVHKLAMLEPESLVFGHGAPIIGGAASQLRALSESLGD
jgi:glyoxylase-like metal-dependent hydrolase (beta-lactamase superfamily II)